MSAIGSLAKTVASPLLAILTPPKVQKTAIAPPAVTPRDNATALEDALSRRSGSEGNQRTGMGGAEARQGRKNKLGA